VNKVEVYGEKKAGTPLYSSCKFLVLDHSRAILMTFSVVCSSASPIIDPLLFAALISPAPLCIIAR
jgi:hypothetical protein